MDEFWQGRPTHDCGCGISGNALETVVRAAFLSFHTQRYDAERLQENLSAATGRASVKQ